MLSILSSILGFMTSGLPSVLGFFQQRGDQKHELEMARMQTERELELKKAGLAYEEKIEQIHLEQIETQSAAQVKTSVIDAQKAEMEAIYKHDEIIGQGASQWVTNLRAATRSILTLGFFLLLVLIDIMIFVHGYQNGASFKDLSEMLWDEDTRIMFAAIITFHFGGRAFGK